MSDGFTRTKDAVFNPNDTRIVACEPYKTWLLGERLNPQGQLRYCLMWILGNISGKRNWKGGHEPLYEHICHHTDTTEFFVNDYELCREILRSKRRLNAEAVRIKLLL